MAGAVTAPKSSLAGNRFGMLVMSLDIPDFLVGNTSSAATGPQTRSSNT
jgi:hypothetical protein